MGLECSARRWRWALAYAALLACSDPEGSPGDGLGGSGPGGLGGAGGALATGAGSGGRQAGAVAGQPSGGVSGEPGAGSGGSAAIDPDAGSSAGSSAPDPTADAGSVQDSGALNGSTPSDGCGSASPPSGTLTFDVAGMSAQYVLTVPVDYDPSHPYPLGFAFHGRNRTGPNCHDGDCAGFDEAMRDQAVLVYMTSLGGTGWEGDGERELNVQFFEALRAHVEASYCIDEGRVFVAGTSSGAHFVNVLGCRFGDRLLAVAPVAGYLPERDGCAGTVAALVIHGVDDSLSTGETARDFYLERNGCTTTTDVPLDGVHADVVADRESHGCVTYQGCDLGKPVAWCEHSEGGYDGSTHGWPLFGGDRIWELVQSL